MHLDNTSQEVCCKGKQRDGTSAGEEGHGVKNHLTESKHWCHGEGQSLPEQGRLDRSNAHVDESWKTLTPHRTLAPICTTMLGPSSLCLDLVTHSSCGLSLNVPLTPGLVLGTVYIRHGQIRWPLFCCRFYALCEGWRMLVSVTKTPEFSWLKRWDLLISPVMKV